MGKDPYVLALDSNAMTDFIEGMNAFLEPPLEPECTALVRIFFWMPSKACFRLTPTVEAEYNKIKDRAKLGDHLSWTLSHLSGVRPIPEPASVETRARELRKSHAGEKNANDCRIVAECELAGLSALLTRDKSLLNKLRMETRVWIVRPSEFWDSMRVPKGRVPNRTPASDNPLLQCSWWQW